MSQGPISQLAELASQRSSKVMNWRLFLNLSLMLFDLAIYVAVAGLFYLQEFRDVHPYSERFGIHVNVIFYIIICALIWVFSVWQAGAYHRHVLGDGYQLGMILFKALVMAVIYTCALNFIFKIDIPLIEIVGTIVIAWVVTMFARWGVRVFLARERRRGQYMYPTVLVGSPEGIGQILKFLRRRGQFNYRPVAVCPIAINPKSAEIMADVQYDLMREQVEKNWDDKLPIMRYDNQLAERISRMGGQTVMVTDVLERFSDNLNTFSLRMESMNLEIALISSAVDISGHVTRMRNMHGTTIMTVCLPQYSPFSRFRKRLFDLVVSSIALIITAIPMLIVAICIKAEDGGPVFYKQERVGLRGKPFEIYKFRSMRVNADKEWKKLMVDGNHESGGTFKMENDPRITKIGKFIRKTSLDELPQFFNVFLGTMSVVGPRPHLKFEVDGFDKVYATRLLVKPGITGPWQVSGRNDLDEEEARQLDVTYVQDWSILGDVVYILRTVGTVLHPNGAY